MKKALLTIIAIAAATNILNAGTYTWTGSVGDGLWFTAGNWSYDDGAGNVTNPAASAPKNNCADDITIDGLYEVSYKPGGDLQISGTLTLANGAYWKQVDGGAYVDVKGGTIHVCSGGVFDTGSSTGSNGVGLGHVVVENGGKVIARRNLNRASLTVKAGGIYELSGAYEFAATDDIQSGGLMTATGNVSLPADVQIISRGYLSTTGEFQPSARSEFANVNLTNKLASMSGKCTLLSGSLTFSGTQSGGLYQGGSDSLYFDFPAGSTCRVTLKDNLSNLYSHTFGTSATTPKYRYDGGPITAAQFETLFEAADNGDGTVSFWPVAISEDAPEIAAGTITMGSTDTSVVVDAAFTRIGDPAATVYLVYDTVDRGRKLADWGDNKILVGTATSLGFDDVVVSGVTARQVLKMRLIAVNTEGSSASDVVSLYTRHYDVEGTVNEWIGIVGNWTDGAQWSLGHAPTSSEICMIDNASAVVTNSSYTLNDIDFMLAGTLILTGELHSDVDYVLDGFNFRCTTFVPNGHRFTIRNGSLTAYRKGSPEQAVAGVYGAGARIDFLSGGTSSMCFLSTGTIYADTFGTSRFLYNGQSIDETEFNKRFAYEQIETPDGVKEGYYAYRLYLKPSEGEPKVESFGATFADGHVLFTLTETEDSIDDTVVTVYYGTTDYGATTNDWAFSGTLVKSAGGVNALSVEVAPNIRYYYALAASSERADMVVWRRGSVVSAELPAGRKVWFGKTADASDPANWQGGTLPGSQDVVEINALFAETKNIEWKVAAIPSVSGWVQSYGVVYFDTTVESAFVISGDVELSGTANWTHIGPAAEPQYCINVSVGGDMTVGSGAIVQAGTAQENNNDYRPRGYRQGPGYLTTTRMVVDPLTQEEVEETVYFGGSYAGDGGHVPFAGPFPSYGSILNPMEWGSAGKGDSADNYSGPGLIVLSVSGGLTVNGSIASHGFGWDGQRAGASGGTVNITAARLAGNGSIDADGGRCLNGPGSGGRVRVKLTGANATFDSFAAPTKIHANPGTFTNITGDSLENDVVLGAAGTVTLQLADDSATSATVIVSDANQNRRDATDPTSLVSATHLPARANPSEKLKETRWSLLGHGKLRLTADVRIASLSLAASDGSQCIYTDGHKLTVGSFVVGGVNRRYGVYTAATDPGLIFGSGSIEVPSGGMVILVR